MKVYYPAPMRPEIVTSLQESLGNGYRVSSDSGDVPGFEVLIEGRPTIEMLDLSPELRAVVVPFAGVPGPTVQLLRNKKSAALFNLHHNAADTAETAMALLLACSRLIVPADRQMREGNWEARYAPSECVHLAGKTVLILGYGHIGKAVARACAGLGMAVLACRRRGTAVERIDGAEVHPASDLPGLLARANALIVAVPQTAETAGLIGPKEIALLPHGAILVNIARGDIVDEAALYHALKEGALHSAGLDVWYRYPSAGSSGVPTYFRMPQDACQTFPANLPFWELDNVVMSPHRGGVSQDTENLRVTDLAELVRAIASGSPPRAVDLQAGY